MSSNYAVMQASAVKAGRVEKPRRRLISRATAAASAAERCCEVIDLQDSSREVSPELAPGEQHALTTDVQAKTCTLLMAFVNTTVTESPVCALSHGSLAAASFARQHTRRRLVD